MSIKVGDTVRVIKGFLCVGHTGTVASITPSSYGGDSVVAAYFERSLFSFYEDDLEIINLKPELTNEPGVTNTINSSTGIKHDQGKARISLLPGLAIEQVMKVGEFGAGKYDDHNFRKGMPVVKYIDAAYRHVFIEWLFKGIDLDIDPDCYQCQNGTCANNPDPKLRKHSGLPHLAHGAWNFLAALEQMLLKPELDNRYKGDKK